MKLLHALSNLLDFNSHLLGQQVLRSVVVRQELVQRRVQKTNGGRQTFQLPENAGKVPLLIRQEFGQRLLPVFNVFGQDHLAHRINAIAFEEHVLGAAQADAGCAEGHGVGGLLRCVGVGAHLHPRSFAAPIHELAEHQVRRAFLSSQRFLDQHLDDFRRRRRELAGIDFTCRTVDGDGIALPENLTVHTHGFR